MPGFFSQFFDAESAAKVKMEADSQTHDFYRKLFALDEDTLDLLRGALYLTLHDTHTGFILIGLISKQLEKFGRCVACDENHDKQLQDMTGLSKEERPAIDFEDKGLQALLHKGDVSAFNEEVSRMLQAKFDEYNVERPDPNQPEVICKGCGMRYPSIRDRMLSAPGVDGCSGCKQKSKWG